MTSEGRGAGGEAGELGREVRQGSWHSYSVLTVVFRLLMRQSVCHSMTQHSHYHACWRQEPPAFPSGEVLQVKANFTFAVDGISQLY